LPILKRRHAGLGGGIVSIGEVSFFFTGSNRRPRAFKGRSQGIARSRIRSISRRGGRSGRKWVFSGGDLPVKIKRLDKCGELPLPAYASEGSSGLDLRAALKEPVVLKPGERKLIPTGLALSVPAGYEAQIRPRSGLALHHGIGMVNAPGTIDSDYRGEIGIILINWGSEPFKIERGDRIAQMVIAKVCRIDLVEVDDLDATRRAGGGFGHTGICE